MNRIAVICPYLSGKGGTETVLSSIAKYNDTFDIQYVLPYKGDDEYWLNDINYRGAKRKFKFGIFNKIYAVFYLINHVLRSKTSIYISLSTQFIFILCILRFLLRKNYKVVSWIHFSLHHEKTVNVKWLVLADCHFAISSGLKKQLINLGVKEKDIFLIYNPIISHDVLPKISSGLDQGKHFVYIGRITYEGQKNLKELITALSKIKGKWRLSIAGTGNDSDVIQCKNLIEKYSLEDNIQWYGWLRDPWSVIKNIDALVMTSTYEGFGMVLGEAISRGVYCIASDCPVGPSDIIINGVNGILYKPGDDAALTFILQSFIESGQSSTVAEIQESISKFYISNYFVLLSHAINTLSREHR